MGGLNNRFISYNSGGLKSKIRMPAWLGSGKGFLTGSQMATFLLCFHMAERKRAL
jgi:hypothetical protein